MVKDGSINKFFVVVPVHNAVQWIEGCLDSICNQDYKHFDIIVIDDHSTDGTWNVIKEYNVNAIRNRERAGALANIVKGINLSRPGDIIVTVDGDDALAHNYVLSYLNGIYTPDVLLTYGSFRPISERYSGTCQDLSDTYTVDESGQWVRNSLTSRTYRRSGVWVTSHLRTFRRQLWDRIDKNDLKYNGEYFRTAWDMAFIYPMIEMAGEKIRFIEKILYIYNDLNPNCDGTVDPQGQINMGKYIQNKQLYDEL